MSRKKRSETNVSTPIEEVPVVETEQPEVVENADETVVTVDTVEETPSVTEAKQEEEVVETPVVDEEPIVEETPAVDTTTEEEQEETPAVTVEAPVAEQPLGYPEVASLLKDGNMDMVTKLRTISTKAVAEIKTVASKLLDYEAELGNGSVSRGGEYAISKCYDLSLTLTSVANTKDRNKFKVKQDIITLAFLAFKDSSMGQLKLLAYDYLWSFGDKQLTTYQNLTTTIATLSDKSTREVNKGKIDVTKMVKGTLLTEQAKTNLVSYYEL